MALIVWWFAGVSARWREGGGGAEYTEVVYVTNLGRFIIGINLLISNIGLFKYYPT